MLASFAPPSCLANSVDTIEVPLGGRLVVNADLLPNDVDGVDVSVTTGQGTQRLRLQRTGVADDARSLAAEGYVGLIARAASPSLRNMGPHFFAAVDGASWVELEAGADLHARLWHSPPGQRRPVRVAAFPGDESWPESEALLARATRVRRIGAALIATAGALDLISAITPPLEQRLKVLLDLVPLAVPQTATALVTVSGLGLLALARGVRRGQARAFRIAMALLVGSFLLHIVKGFDFEEASAAAIAGGYLFTHRGAFATVGRTRAIRHGISAAFGAFVAVVATITAVIEIVTAAEGHRVTVPRAALATVERMAGIETVDLPRRLNDFASPMLVAVGIGFAFWIAWQAIQPAAARRGTHDDVRRARQVVARFGSGTLDYFALREDKEFFFWRESLVAYAVHQGVCLISPDPIGPEWERDAVFDAFHSFADGHGWTLAVMGAGEPWLPIYRRAGMHDVYVGDEAVVDITRFSLEGGRNKGMRQAYNRIVNHGYTCTFHDPSTADDELKASVEAVMGLSRRGDVERGFSMTLGRLFHRDDRGLLLAVCRDGDGNPVAFCQYVPAPGIEGYSLDLMRRDAGEHPNGLLDFVIVATILHLRETGSLKLGLNFATMRAVLAGETGEGLTTRVERWALKRMSGSMQIESLWKFNAKFDPDWQPRYAVYDTVGNIVPIAFAIARAESFWELPVIGRFLMPPTPPSRP